MAIEIFPVTEKVFGSSYEEHIKKYWTFFLKTSKANNPLAQVEGHVQTGQNSTDPVFYIPCNLGGKSKISCKIPSGKSVLIPVMCIVIVFGEKPQFNSTQQMHKTATKDQDSVVSMSFTINGTNLNINDLKKFRVHTGEFTVDIPQDGLYNHGVNPAVSDGYYVITKPLGTGTYAISLNGNMVCVNSPDCYEPKFNTNHDVTLTVG